MILDTFATIYGRTTTLDSEGVKVWTYTPLKTISANLQPVTLTENQAQEWGVSTTASGARLMFFAPDSSIEELMRVSIAGNYYQIRNVSPWPNHYEATLIPAQGLS